MIWNYKKANVDCIRKLGFISFHCGFVLSRKNVHQQVQYLNEILMKVFYNYIPNKRITIDNKDPPWMNDEIKIKINYRNTFYQQLKKYKINLTDLDVVNELTSELSSIISQRKDEYSCHLAKKLNEPETNAKIYWPILKIFFSGRKIPVIPRLFIDGKLLSDFKEKVTNLMNFLAVSVHL